MTTEKTLKEKELISLEIKNYDLFTCFDSKDVKEAVLEFEKYIDELFLNYNQHQIKIKFKEIFGDFEK
jgi:hypothetical protein